MNPLLPKAARSPNEAELARQVRSFGVKSVTGNYTVDPTDNTIRVDTTAGNVSITLPAAALMQERVTTIKKISVDANTVTVVPATGETIDGSSSLVLSTQWQSFALQSDGTTWSRIWAYDTATPASVAAEAATRAAADSAEASARAAADSSEATARANADSLLQAKSEKNQPSGYAGLDGSSKLTGSQQVYGTAVSTACEGNDSRLSDTRTPTDNTVSTAKLQNDAVTYPKIQNVSATDKVLGRSTAGAGDIEEIACTVAGRALIDDADAAAQRTTLGLAALATKATVGTADIDNDAVTYAKMQNVSATDKLLGRSTAGAGDVEEIICTAAGRALLDDAAASNQRTTLGLGSTDAVTFLRMVLAVLDSSRFTIDAGGGGQEIANNAVATWPAIEAGLAFLYDVTAGGAALVAIYNGSSTALVWDAGAAFSVVAGTASKLNCYQSAGTFNIENKRGSSHNIRGFILRAA